MKEKYYREDMGWGEIVLETEHYIVVRWDADPWCLEQIPKF